jgi:poly(3-hydroxybutyrate) depolymerase
MRVLASILIALAGSAVPAAAQGDGRTKAQLLRRPYTSTAAGQTAEKDREYLVYLPQGYETEKGKLWPVLLFLHGGGERGNGKSDLEKTLAHGPLMEAWVKGARSAVHHDRAATLHDAARSQRGASRHRRPARRRPDAAPNFQGDVG